MARRISVELIGNSASLERAFSRGSRASRGFERNIARVNAESGALARGVLSSSGALSRFGGVLALTSGSFFAGAGLGVALESTAKKAANFQTSLNVLQVTTRATGQAMLKAGDLARKLGADVSIPAASAADAAGAMTELAKGGLSLSQAMAAAKGTLQLAAAANLDVASAAKINVSALNSFSLSGNKASHIANILAGAAAASQGEISDMALALQQAAAQAHATGLSADETVIALSELAKSGIQGADAGTSLRRVLQQLTPVSKRAQDELKRLGINVKDARGNFRPFREIIVQFHDALTKMTPVQRAFALNLVFGSDASRAANIIFGQSVDVYDKLRKQVERQNAAQQLASGRTKGAAGAMLALSNAVDTLQINIGTKLLPKFTPLITDLANWVSRLAESENKTHRIANAIEGFVGQVGKMAGGVKGAVQQLGGFKAALEGIGTALALLKFGPIAIPIAAVALGPDKTKQIADQLLATVRRIDWNKIGRAIGPGLAAAIASAFATLLDPSFWLKNWDLALAIGISAFPGGKIAGKLGEKFAKIGGDLALKLAQPFERFGSRVSGLVLSGLIHLGDFAGRLLKPVGDRIASFFRRMSPITRFVVKVLGIQTAIDAVANMMKEIANLITGNLDAAWKSMQRAAIKAVLDIIEPFTHIPDFFGISLGSPFRKLKDNLQKQLDAMVASAQKAADDIATALAGAGGVGAGARRGGTTPRTHPPIAGATPRAASPVVAAAQTAADTTATSVVDTSFTLPFRLRLAQAKAEATKTASDDIAVAKQIRTFILQAIPKLHGEKLISAYGELKQVNDTIAGQVQAAADKLKGFAVPLALQVAEARAEALGKDDQLQKILLKIKAAAQKALKSGRLGLQGQLDAWNMLKGINDQLGNAGKSAASLFRKAKLNDLVAGLNLTPDQLKAFRARASQIGIGGTISASGVGAFGVAMVGGGETVIHVPVNIDGRPVANIVTRHQQKTKRRNPSQRRGPFAGGGL